MSEVYECNKCSNIQEFGASARCHNCDSRGHLVRKSVLSLATDSNSNRKIVEKQRAKLSEARADALRMAGIALVYIRKEIGTIEAYEDGHGSYAAGLDGVSAEEIIAKYEEE